MDIELVGWHVVDGSISVHSGLGPGLLESAYKACLTYELRKRGLRVETEVPLPVIYDGVKVDAGYRIDLLVEGCVVVELKAVERTPGPRRAATVSPEAQRPQARPAHQLQRRSPERWHQTNGKRPVISPLGSSRR